MGRTVDVDNLIDTATVAELLGLSHHNSVRTYRGRYSDFPEPVWTSTGGRCMAWLRSDIEAWRNARASER